MASPQSALIVGCGDIGQRIARLLLAREVRVAAWVRTQASLAHLLSAGLAARVVDLDGPPDAIAPVDLAFYCAPPPGSGTRDPRLKQFLEAATGRVRRLVYISTSGVYGDCGGRWIDEDEPLKPQTDRARRRLDAEQALAAVKELETVVLRVPGIYGPGRLPVERLRSGQPVLRVEDSPWSNRVHADDLTTAAVMAADRGTAGAAYNVSDGHPTTMTDYFLSCARLLRLPQPPQVGIDRARAEFSRSLLSFLEESKRLRNDRLRGLGWAPSYPDLDTGLPSCVI
jgi:nucleoside-diphosphate-sugar epimerase